MYVIDPERWQSEIGGIKSVVFVYCGSRSVPERSLVKTNSFMNAREKVLDVLLPLWAPVVLYAFLWFRNKNRFCSIAGFRAAHNENPADRTKYVENASAWRRRLATGTLRTNTKDVRRRRIIRQARGDHRYEKGRRWMPYDIFSRSLGFTTVVKTTIRRWSDFVRWGLHTVVRLVGSRCGF